MSHQDINVAEFISVLIHVSEECGKVIRNVAETGGHKKQASKDDESPVTEADLIVQKTIEVVLNKLYPTLRVEGEESAASIKDKKPAVNPDAIADKVKQFIKQDWLNSQHDKRGDYIKNKLRQTYKTDAEIQVDHYETFNTKDAVVWIDPLDGTSDFVKENFSACTVLIGLSVAGYSRIGVVHQPFTPDNMDESATYFGTGEHGAYRLKYNKSMTMENATERTCEYLCPFDHEQPGDKTIPKDKNIRIAASLQHFSANMTRIADKIGPVEVVKLGGAGNKCNNIAIGTVDTYLHPSPGLKFWDLCAPESIIKAMGGYATDFKLERVVYVAGADPNLKGLILAKNPLWHHTIVSRLADERQVIYDLVFNKKKEEKKPEAVAAPVEEKKVEEPAATEVKQVEEPTKAVEPVKTEEPVKAEEPKIVTPEAKPEEPKSSQSSSWLAYGVIGAAVVGVAAYVIHKNQ